MGGVLFLAQQMVYGDVDRLRRAIAGHTGSEETASQLVAEIMAARSGGGVETVTLLPSTGDGVGGGWKVRVRHNPLAF